MVEEARECLNCQDPACSGACPLDNRIPEFLSKVGNGNFNDAMRTILEENPLPGITGYVCPSFCQSSCVRGVRGSPIKIREMEKIVSEKSSVRPNFGEEKTGKRVAVVGSGPAGLAGAFFLRKAGHEVTVYEKSPVVGGMMALGIPDFRLPRKVLESELRRIKNVGVEIKSDSPVKCVDELWEEGFDAVLSAIGSSLPKNLDIPGEDLEGVHHAIRFLKQFNLGESIALGKRVAIIGGGNAALDAARAANRMGLQPMLVYRRSRREMPAYEEETKKALEEGVDMKFQVQPKKFLGNGRKVSEILCARTELKELEGYERRRPAHIENSDFKIEIDGVIEAVGQKPDYGWAERNGIATNESGLIKVGDRGPAFSTSKGRVYAAGDAVLGSSSISEAMKTAKIAARSIDDYLES